MATTATRRTTTTVRRPPASPSATTVEEGIVAIARDSCTRQAEDIYAQSGTRDPQRAAEWIAETWQPQYRPAVIAACFEALIGGR